MLPEHKSEALGWPTTCQMKTRTVLLILHSLKSIVSVVWEKDKVKQWKALVSVFKASIKQRALDISASNTWANTHCGEEERLHH